MTGGRTTIFSPCRQWRYTLWREFQTEFLFDGGNRMREGFVQFIGLNPSTADENRDDNTVRRCIAYAKALGYGTMCMTNLFAWRDTDPSAMKRVKEPIGEDNHIWLNDVATDAAMIICAWGRDGNHMEQGQEVLAWMKLDFGHKLHHLGLNGDGTPKHPLYLAKTLTPIPFIKSLA